MIAVHDGQAAVSAEVAALADEATMPLEQLMALYGLRGGADGSPAERMVPDSAEPAASPSSDDAADAGAREGAPPYHSHLALCSAMSFCYCSQRRPPKGTYRPYRPGGMLGIASTQDSVCESLCAYAPGADKGGGAGQAASMAPGAPKAADAGMPAAAWLWEALFVHAVV